MPVTASLIGAGTNLVGGLISGIVGGKQKREGKNILAQADKLGAFNEQVPSEVTALASQGLPSEQYNQAMNNIQQQQLQALNAAQTRRAGIGAIGGIQSATNNATLGLDTQNALARQNNMLRLASWKDKVWQNNVKAKYNQQYNYGMGLLGQGNQNIVGGIDKATAGGAQGLYAGLLGGGSYNPGSDIPFTGRQVGNIPTGNLAPSLTGGNLAAGGGLIGG